MKLVLTEQIVLAEASKITWADSNKMLVPERKTVLRILQEMHEERQKRVEAKTRPTGAQMHLQR